MSKTIENYTNMINAFTRGGFSVEVSANKVSLNQKDAVVYEGTIEEVQMWFLNLCVLRGAHFKQVQSLKRWIYFWAFISAACVFGTYYFAQKEIVILTIIACVLGAGMWIFNAVAIYRTNKKLFLDIK